MLYLVCDGLCLRGGCQLRDVRHRICRERLFSRALQRRACRRDRRFRVLQRCVRPIFSRAR